MKTTMLPIKEGQYLGDILSAIPINSIATKTLPALGATTLEIECQRNSIIIEPNVPVIKGKVAKYKALGVRILGVFSGIDDDVIIDYIKSDQPNKKILTTPESYILRVKPILELYSKEYHKEFMLLYDESERTVQDVGYRDTITAPLEDFFRFENKAMITATPIHPSDPRFEKHGFQHLIIKPDFNYSKPLRLQTTNNVLLNVKDYLKDNEAESYCFFLNSTTAICSLIKYLNICDDSQIFCSKKSVKVIKRDKAFHVSNDLKPLKKYNFFTSSFFSAVDIDLDIKPDVIILSDLFFAEHSIIDPATEAIQIVGRFRKGVNKITHITNINPDIHFQTREEIKSYLDGCHETYSVIHSLYTSATGLGQKKTLEEALKWVSYSKYVDKEGNKNYFMIDNKLDEDMVRSYYCSNESLLSAYSKLPHFKVTHSETIYPLSDEHRFKRLHYKDDNELFKSIVEQLCELNKTEFRFQIDNRNTQMKELSDLHPEFCELFHQLGVEAIEKVEYRVSKAKKLLSIKRKSEEQTAFPVIGSLLKPFQSRLGVSIPCSELNAQVDKVKTEYGLKLKNIDLLNKVFEISERSLETIGGSRVWTRKLSNPKFILPSSDTAN